MSLQRIVVVGTTGSGKTTLASTLSQRLGLPHIELDALNWGPSWTPAPRQVLKNRVRQAVAADRWVLDGNYSVVRPIIWARAHTIVWLDYSMWVILPRLLRRTFRRVFTRKELWGGNRECFWSQFLHKDSLFLWALHTYRRRRVEYPWLLGQPKYDHIHWYRLRTPAFTRRWLETHAPLIAECGEDNDSN